jgi:OHCU decarboxylase
VQRELERLNGASPSDTQDELLKCCGSQRWAQELVQRRPFATVEDLKREAESIWWSLSSADWVEAFRSHPKIGERKAAADVQSKAQEWSEQEQSAVSTTTEETLRKLSDLNRQYEAKFGYIFIVCASGKSAEEMLSLLTERLRNNPEQEIRIAATEQAKITDLRISKLLNQ